MKGEKSRAFLESAYNKACKGLFSIQQYNNKTRMREKTELPTSTTSMSLQELCTSKKKKKTLPR